MKTTIGIAIKITSNGSGDPKVINGGEWVQHVADVRPVLDKVRGADSGNRQVVRFLSFTDEGCFITVARCIAGRQGDNVAAWIFIPSKLVISGKEAFYIMDMVEQTILAQKIDTTELEKICKQPYPLKPDGYSKTPCGEGLAYRFYDDNTIEDILGPHRYQGYYDDYRYCLLFEQNGMLTMANYDEATDLTARTNEPMSLVMPVTAEALRQHFGYDVEMRLADDTPFDKPVSVKEGGKLQLQLVREGYQPIKFSFTKESSAPQLPFPLRNINPTTVKWQIPLLFSDFHIADEDGKAIATDQEDKITIRVNNTLLVKPGQPSYIDEKEAQNANVEVTSKSLHYQRASVKANLTQKPVSIRLPFRRENKNATVIDSNGEKASLDYQVKGIAMKDASPLKGYYFDSHEQLVYDTRRPWVLRLQGFAVAAIAALISLLAVYLLPTLKKEPGTQQHVNTEQAEPPRTTAAAPAAGTQQANEQPSTTSEQAPASEQAIANDQQLPAIETPAGTTGDANNMGYEQALAYLEGNTVWKRSEMEQYEILQGLFDDMNEFHLDKIITRWSQELAASPRFQKIVDVAKKNKNHKWNPVTGAHMPFYNKPDDEAIAVTNYIYWLDRDQTQPAPQPNSQPATQTKNGGKSQGKTAAKTQGKGQAKTQGGSKLQAGSGNKNID